MIKPKKIIKKIPYARRMRDKILFAREYNYDKKLFLNNYVYSTHDNSTKTGYDILLKVHSLEKGLSTKNTKPEYLKDNIVKIVSLIEKIEKQNIDDDYYPYVMAINGLREYCHQYDINNWEDQNTFIKAKKVIDRANDVQKLSVGSQTIDKKTLLLGMNFNYETFLKSRHSVRNFSDKKLSDKDIKKAIEIARLSPSACNRQMCKIYYIKNPSNRKKVIKYGQGFGCFELDNMQPFIITFDISANYMIGERNQGWLNAGLMGMNFVNALHSLGIGSCFIQSGNSSSEEQQLKKDLNIPEHERLAIIIAAGYYDKDAKIPFSARKNITDIYDER